MSDLLLLGLAALILTSTPPAKTLGIQLGVAVVLPVVYVLGLGVMLVPALGGIR